MIEFSPIGVDGMMKVTNGAGLLDFEHGYSVEKAYDMLDQLGEKGRQFYLSPMMIEDIFFPVSVMLFFGSWISFFLKILGKANSNLSFLLLFPILDMLFDWGENVGITTMLLNYPTQLPTVCNISSAITMGKFVWVICNAVCFITLTVCTLVHACIKRKQSSKLSHYS